MHRGAHKTNLGTAAILVAALCTGACIAGAFGPFIDYGNGPVVGGSSNGIVSGTTEAGSEALADLYKPLMFHCEFSLENPCSSFETEQLAGPNGEFHLTGAFIARGRTTEILSAQVFIPTVNRADTARCGVQIHGLKLVYDDGFEKRTREEIVIAGSSAISGDVQLSACVAPGELGYFSVQVFLVTYDAVEAVKFDEISYLPDKHAELVWQQPTAALIPTSHTYDASGGLRVSFENRGLQAAVFETAASNYYVLAPNGDPVFSGIMRRVEPAGGIYEIGDTGTAVDDQSLGLYNGPIDRIHVFLSFYDWNIYRRRQAAAQ